MIGPSVQNDDTKSAASVTSLTGEFDDAAVRRFDFRRLPDSCLGLLDYLQRALDETWERISPTPEPRRIIRRDRMTISDPSPDQIIRKEQAELERRRSCYAGFVTAFQQVSRPLQELFVGLKMPHLDFGATELPFFDFTVEPEAIRASQSAISDPLNEVELLFPRVAAHVLNAAFERAELPADWLPGRATVRFNRDHAADIERYPTFPIRSSSDLTKWLMQWCLRCAKPNRHALYERKPSSHWEFPKWRRLSDEDSYAPELEDFTRELRNCRRALLIWGITGSTNGEGDPPDLSAAEDRAMSLINSLREAEPRTPNPRVDLTKTSGQSGNIRTAPKAEFVFRPDGDGYLIRGFGESGHVTAEGAKGLHDLFRLVQTPGVPVPMLELDAGPGVNRVKGDGRSRQPVAGGEEFKQLAAKRKQLKADIESAGSDLERSELQAELGKLEKTAKGMKGLNGKPRDLNNPLDKLRPKLLKRISTAGNRLRKANLNKLADHFGSAVTSEAGCLVYRPAVEGLTWNVTNL